MGREARLNPVAVANNVPKRNVTALDIGDGFAVIGCALEPAMDADGNFVVLLSVVGGKKSDLVPLIPVKIILGEIAKVTAESLREKIGAVLDPPAQLEAAECP